MSRFFRFAPIVLLVVLLIGVPLAIGVKAKSKLLFSAYDSNVLLMEMCLKDAKRIYMEHLGEPDRCSYEAIVRIALTLFEYEKEGR